MFEEGELSSISLQLMQACTYVVRCLTRESSHIREETKKLLQELEQSCFFWSSN